MIAFESVVVLPPHPNGLWTASSSHEEDQEIDGSIAGISEGIIHRLST